ncbi:hypothetical protein BO94DRAFT_547416 [Aspergillus sclerotioniger CBS 115572]|uniref:Mid2 domain-containing protein n=1 Tax=Aspergillus sclerotioniger CBS 115572 TaxID=1450535 RepID=A0A317WEW2_9EURO|nr:hypothetical protein BO94DRAFT_547416 [Aspergillus sclerotioniger CBS 115572]PWY83762.1 hypothetical protein BO94DRAFT_547416 [Aspergillus sclerotioniger CBS 115572]
MAHWLDAGPESLHAVSKVNTAMSTYYAMIETPARSRDNTTPRRRGRLTNALRFALVCVAVAMARYIVGFLPADSDSHPEYTAAGVDLTACDDSGTKYCCGPSAEACCKAGNYTTIDKETGEIIAIGTSTIATTSTATSTSTSSSSISTSIATSATTTTAAGSSASSAVQKSSGMSEGTKLGIGLGVGLGVPLLLVGAAAIFFWRRSQRKPTGSLDEKVFGQGASATQAVLLENSELRGKLPENETRHELQ